MRSLGHRPATPHGGSEPAIDATPLLRVEDLHVQVRTRAGVVPVTRGVNLELDAGETLTILGESGSGKTVTAEAIMGTLASPPFSIPQGRILLSGQDILRLSPSERRNIRGERVAMVFQDALSALNPVFSVGWQIGEMLRRRRGMTGKDALRRAAELMGEVRIPSASSRVKDYPHEFSGGMRQRVAIAMALALEPDIVIADEPTTALDVTVQAQILKLLAELQHDYGMALIMITHDMGIAAQISDRVNVMYGGRILESGSVRQVFEDPAHPYTRDLLTSIPRADKRARTLLTIEGSPPSLDEMPEGCPYHPRCRLAVAECRVAMPAASVMAVGHTVRCFVTGKNSHE